jgi:hypothetical protein
MRKQAYRVTYVVAGSKIKKVYYIVSATKKNIRTFLSQLTIIAIEKCSREEWMLNI